MNVGIYSSDQSILLVGEGDFSFALSLAKGFGDGSLIIATSLDKDDDAVTAKHEGAASNISQLLNLKAKIFYGVDATEMSEDPRLRDLKFDRIIFQFPHCVINGKKPLSDEVQEAVRVFEECREQLVTDTGEIHTTIRTHGWNIEQLVEDSVTYLGSTEFIVDSYEGYRKQHSSSKQAARMLYVQILKEIVSTYHTISHPVVIITEFWHLIMHWQ